MTLRIILTGIFLVVWISAPAAQSDVAVWRAEFPRTDFARHEMPLSEIVTDGPRRDTIPPILEPRFVAASSLDGMGPMEPVLSIVIAGDARAYPLRILLWHEIVNDVVGGVPVLVSYCPLCNSGVVFDRRLDGKVLEFGNTGRIRHFDMVMYDRGTESWWQQFLGEAIVGTLSGKRLRALPARLESLTKFRARAPDGKVLVPENPGVRPYGLTPFAGVDDAAPRAFTAYPLPAGVSPTARVVVVGAQAWLLALIARRGTFTAGELRFGWTPGQNSIHDTRIIATGRDVGNVTVRRHGAAGLVDVPHDVTFAFAFRAFVPHGTIHTE